MTGAPNRHNRLIFDAILAIWFRSQLIGNKRRLNP